MGTSQANAVAVIADTERPIAPTGTRKPNISRILRLEVTSSVVLAERLITIESILGMTAGTIIEFEVPFDAELKLNVGNRTIARGQTVKVGENFGLRLTDVAAVPDRVDALGGADHA